MLWLNKAKSWIVWGGSYFLLAKFSMLLFAAEPSNIALLWLPAGLGPFLFYRYGAGVLTPVFLASLGANFSGLSQDSITLHLFHTSISAGADTLFVLLAGTAARHYLTQGINRPRQLFMAFLLGCLLPTGLTGSIIGWQLWWGGYLTAGSAQATAVSIWLADMLGVLLVIPVLVAFARRKEEAGGLSPGWVIATLLTFGLILASFLVAHWLLFLVIPALVFIVFGSKSLYTYCTMGLALLLYNALAVQFYHLEIVSPEWLEVLTFSISVSFAVIVLSVQQRMLRHESGLRQEWQTRASHDPLTGLPNRIVLMSLLQHEVERFHRANGSFSIAMLDIDHFKRINDTYGHAAGDAVLIEFSKRIDKMTRSADVVGRLGGEEFLLLLPETDAASAHHVLDNLRARVADDPFEVSGNQVQVTFSTGIAQCSRASSAKSLLEEADQHLYYAKQSGRNRVSVTSRVACES
ncbi:diguanylate cyclase [Marinobacterium stanieri]|uniref:GGDEF domain-containing protein n=1 Tax=Marinobacterium stanieri TaxID=49186 RepID=UPI003A93EE44